MTRPAFPGWNDTTEAQLRQFVGESLSSSKIAKKLNTTRNAIVGKCARLGITLVGDPNDAASARRIRQGKGSWAFGLKSHAGLQPASPPRRFSWQEPLDVPAEPA